jgi:hypothetical protein
VSFRSKISFYQSNTTLVRRDGKVNPSFMLDELSDNRYFAACPIKLLLILAMRLGVCPYQRYNDTVVAARKRKDKKVVWTKPGWPVLLAIGSAAASLCEGKPAAGGQLNRTVQLASIAAGLIGVVRSHDLRRGAARDVARIRAPLKTIATDTVATVLGHSERARQAGLTQNYVGAASETRWAERLDIENEDIENADIENNDPFGLQFASTPMQKRRLPTEALTKEILDRELDPRSKKVRRRVAWDVKRQELTNWTKAQADAETEDVSEAILDDLIDPNLMDSNEIDDPPVTIEIQSLLTGGTVPAEYTTEVLEIDAVDSVSTQAKDPRLDVLTKSTTSEEFIHFFASNNTVLCATDITTRLKSVARGGSRDEPSCFIRKCPNAKYGCEKTFNTGHSMDAHLQICKSTSIDAHAAAQAPKKCACPHCQCSYGTMSELNQHIRTKHEGKQSWVPKPCPEAKCDNTIIYETQSKYRAHVQKVHVSFIACRCPIGGCYADKKEHKFESGDSLKKHLRDNHSMKEKKPRQEVVDRAQAMARETSEVDMDIE